QFVKFNLSCTKVIKISKCYRPIGEKYTGLNTHIRKIRISLHLPAKAEVQEFPGDFLDSY
ncbi:MAG: hypothetical protein ACK47R_23825, partial [Planctomycetia bacterium]